MEFRFTLADGHRVRTLAVRARPGTSWVVVRALLGLAPDLRLEAEYGDRRVPLTGDARVGTPPLVHGVVLRPATDHRAPPGPTTAPAALWVTSGPDAGARLELPPGGLVTVGRDPWCDLRIEDPGLSRHHLTVTVTRAGVVVQDAGSTNGTTVGGAPVTGPTNWVPGIPLRLGATEIALVPAQAEPARARPDGAGYLTLLPARQAAPPVAPVEVSSPPPPEAQAPSPPAVLGWLLPLLVSVLLALVLQMPALMLFGLMAPAMSLGGYAGERRRHRREGARAAADHAADVAAVRRHAEQLADKEQETRWTRTPDAARLAALARERTGLLWSRPPEEVICRVGRAAQDTTVLLDGSPLHRGDVPVEVSLAGGIGIVGDHEEVGAAARHLLLQLVTLHAPSALALRPADDHVLDAPEWSWLAWVPHVTPPGWSSAWVVTLHDHRGRAAAPVAEPVGAGGEGAGGAGAGGAGAGGAGAGGAGADTGRVAVVLADDESSLPDVGTVVALRAGRMVVRSREGAPRMGVPPTGAPLMGVPDLVSEGHALRVARALAPLREAAGETDNQALPSQVSFTDVIQVSLEGDALCRTWRERPRSTAFPLGTGPDGPLVLDLATDGPHALVAGTTGAGKSELLRTLVASLAVVNRPDELVLVLVDYKGGSAFADAAALPHTVGLITDLDPHLADRALTSLTAELKRRERVLGQAGVPDLPAYQRLSGVPPLPRLVIVIDEFRALSEELPGFLDGLVRIAALGRSLGVHLILATQRPGGVVSADVRANVNLRIALRVRDASDSYDVLETADAATLPERRPGRALVRTGADPPRLFQVASTGAPPTPGNATAPVGLVPVTNLWQVDEFPAVTARAEEAESLLSRVCAAATQAAEQVGAVAPPSPWLAPLPGLITLDELPEHGPPRWATAPLLLQDLPAEQAQRVHSWAPLEDGHLAVVGAPRTGRTSTLRTVLASLLAEPSGEAHLYVIDLAGGLGPLAAHPQVGAALGPTDVTLGVRVIDHLTRLCADRQRALAAAGHTSLSEQRASSEDPWPLVVLVIDGWARFTEVYGEVDRGRPMEQVLQLLREGLACGVVAAVTGDRSLLTGRVASLLPELWSLRLTDPTDLLLAGLTRAQVPGSMPPGRVVRVRDGVVGQVAVVGASADGAAQVRTIDEVVQAGLSAPPGAPGPRRFRPLPRTVALTEVREASAGLTVGGAEPTADGAEPTADGAGPTAGGGLLVGVGGEDGGPLVLPLGPGLPGCAAIIGPARSGRSTLLATLATAARRHRCPVLEVSPAHLKDPETLRDDLAALTDLDRSNAVVLIDDFDRVAGTEAEDLLTSWAAGTAQLGGILIAAGSTEDLSGFRGLAPVVVKGRVGILLQPSRPADGHPLGVDAPVGDEPLPGRGVLVDRGRTAQLQVALPT